MIDLTKDTMMHLDSVLSSDIAFLRNLELMDYSLLLIIIHFPNPDEEEYQQILEVFGDNRYCKRIFKSKNMKYIYCFGIIDYLQKFNLSKFFENKYKSLLYGNEIKYVSAVDPMIYGTRLLEFSRQYIFISNDI